MAWINEDMINKEVFWNVAVFGCEESKLPGERGAAEIWIMEMGGNSLECKNYGDRKTGRTGNTKYDTAEQAFERWDQEKLINNSQRKKGQNTRSFYLTSNVFYDLKYV